ncbi:MAG TPA: hypothetical protein VE035_04590 [Puia sp.]|nr:hypothetical protein [Puia sp.]
MKSTLRELIEKACMNTGKRMIIGLALVISVVVASCTVEGRYVVRERPAEVVYVRPAPPSREHIWVTGDWVWVGNRYQWREGHWERPRSAARWENGHWQETSRGWKWIPGHWTRA